MSCDIHILTQNLGQATNNFVAINIEGETNNGRESILKDAAASMYAGMS